MQQLYERVSQHRPDYDFVSFFNFQLCLDALPSCRYVEFKYCCTDQYPKETNEVVICRTCGIVLRYQVYKFEFPFRNEDSSGHATSNSGRQAIPEKRRYKQITNLKFQYKQYMGWAVNGAAPCPKYNSGTKCRPIRLNKCKFAHKCSYCEGPHTGKSCKHKNWLNEIVFNRSDRNAYMAIRQQLRKRKMPWQYRNIFGIIYKLGGLYPKHSAVDGDKIIVALIVIENFFHQRQKGQREGAFKKRSLGSSKMLLSSVLKMTGNEPFYRLPELKNKQANEKVNEFFYLYSQHVSDQLKCQ